MASGSSHNLMLDSNANVYSFGFNISGQCGFDTKSVGTQILSPKLLEISSEENVIEIKCGDAHSYLKSSTLRHYLFGDNRYNQCSLSSNNKYKKKVSIPICINPTFGKLSQGKRINKVYLGRKNTFIIAQSEDDGKDTEKKDDILENDGKQMMNDDKSEVTAEDPDETEVNMYTK